MGCFKNGEEGAITCAKIGAAPGLIVGAVSGVGGTITGVFTAAQGAQAIFALFVGTTCLTVYGPIVFGVIGAICGAVSASEDNDHNFLNRPRR